VRDNTGRFCTS